MKNKIFSLIALVFLLSSCELNQKDIEPTDNFVKIYNDPDENSAYYVQSVLPVSGGYIILSGLKDFSQNLNEYPTVSLIGTNELGETQWSQTLAWRSPVNNLINLNGSIGFVAMDNNDDAYFVTINAESGEETGSTPLNLKMPLAADVTSEGTLVVLSYDYISWSSVVSVFSESFSLIGSQKLAVGEDLVVPVQKHLNKNNTEFPFFIGEWNNGSQNGFFVNCLYNYTLGVRFFTNDATSTGGWIYSHQIENGISSLLHKEGDSYGMTRFYNNKNYINPTLSVDVASLQNFNDSTQNPIPRIEPKARVSAITATFGGVDYMLFASTTNSNSVIVYQYAMDSDELYHEVEIAFAHKVEVMQVLQDANDEGIVLLARHYINGSYLRPVLIKIPVRDFKS